MSAVGSAELEEAGKLNASVLQLYAAEKYKEALPLAERVLALHEKALKADDLLIGNALNNLAFIYLALKETKKFELLAERILSFREKRPASTSAATMNVLTTYSCLVSVKRRFSSGKGKNLSERINMIMLQDSIVAAGLTLPNNLDDVSSLPIKNPPPRYPTEAKSGRLQGTILVMVDVDETGKVMRAEPVPCLVGQNPLAEASAEAARQSRFAPVLIAGQPIKRKVLRAYNFVLQ